MLSGRVCIVTGSTSGIGLGIAECLAKQGATLLLTGSRSEEEAKNTVQDVAEKYSVRVEYCQADFRYPEEAANKVLNTALNKFGAVHVLVNNAGIQHVATVEEFPVEKWDEILAVNLTSCFHTTKLAIPHMKKNEGQWGRIINISSVHGLVASVNKSAYVAAKHGLNGLTKVVALELAANTQITANAICPGYVLTPLVQKQIESRAKLKGLTMEAATEDLVGEKQPSKRFTTCEQIGEMVVFLCSHAASNLTGSIQAMDGGWTTH